MRGQRSAIRFRPARLEAAVEEGGDIADAVRIERAIGNKPVVRDYAAIRHKAGSWNRERRAVARIEATRLGLDIRFVVNNVARGSAEWVYDSLYCARSRAENLIKLHKSQLRSDRTSCRSALANQVRLVLHTAAYWLMLDVRDVIPKIRDLAKAEFTTLRTQVQIRSFDRENSQASSLTSIPLPRRGRRFRDLGTGGTADLKFPRIKPEE